MAPKQVIKTSNAPDPVGPYNQAIKAGDFIYCSGQIAIDPALNEITCLGDIEKETIQVLKNLEAVLDAGGAKIEDVIKTTIYLTDLSNFQIVNKIYSEFFNVENPPARACVEVSSLPKGVLVEIDCVAFLDWFLIIEKFEIWSKSAPYLYRLLIGWSSLIYVSSKAKYRWIRSRLSFIL